MLNQANYSSARENHCTEGEAKREERRRGKKFSIPSACQACFKLRATAVLKSTDRINLDLSTAVERCLKQASTFWRVAVSTPALTHFTHSIDCNSPHFSASCPFSCGVIFARARVSLSLPTLRKNGD